MIFRELSNAVFRFVIRCAGAEIDGGVFKHPPPPSRSWKIQRPSRARVNYKLMLRWVFPFEAYRVFCPFIDALRCFQVSREGHIIPPPPGRAKVTQTPGRVRVYHRKKRASNSAAYSMSSYIFYIIDKTQSCPGNK